jgi:hypothetical protein
MTRTRRLPVRDRLPVISKLRGLQTESGTNHPLLHLNDCAAGIVRVPRPSPDLIGFE